MIVVKNLYKKFQDKQVLEDISFHVAPFECVGIIGKNGAGKTTLLDIITGILREDSGFIRIKGGDNANRRFKTLKRISYISGMRSQLWEDMKLAYSFDNCAKMYDINYKEYKKRKDILVEYLELENCLDKPIGYLSLGQKMRGELIYALLPEPEILFLDEALIGIDISAKEKVMSLLEELKIKHKTTIIYTSHNLAEVERLCDKIILIDKGRIIFDGKKDYIMEHYAPEYLIEINIIGEFPDMEDLPIEKYCIDDEKLSIRFRKQKISSAEIIKHIFDKTAQAKAIIKDIKIIEPKLEDTIKNIYALDLERNRNINKDD